jgi:hypothetical protein
MIVTEHQVMSLKGAFYNHLTDFLEIDPQCDAQSLELYPLFSIFARMALPYIRRVNDWQFLSLPEPWTLVRIGNERRMQKKGTGMHLFWSSSTPCRRDGAGP